MKALPTVENLSAQADSNRPVFKVYAGLALVLPEGTEYLYDYKGDPIGFKLPNGKIMKPVLGFEVWEDPNDVDADSFDVTHTEEIEAHSNGQIIDALPPDIKRDGVNSVDRVFRYSNMSVCIPNPSRLAVME